MYSNILSDDSCTSTSSSPTIPIKVGAPSYLSLSELFFRGQLSDVFGFSPFIG